MKINFFTFDQNITTEWIFHKRSSKFYYCFTGAGGGITTVAVYIFGWLDTCCGSVFWDFEACWG